MIFPQRRGEARGKEPFNRRGAMNAEKNRAFALNSDGRSFATENGCCDRGRGGSGSFCTPKAFVSKLDKERQPTNTFHDASGHGFQSINRVN